MNEEMQRPQPDYKGLYESLTKEFEQYKKESVKYTVDDIINAGDDYTIETIEAQKALEAMVCEVDKQEGINRDTFIQYLEDFGYFIEDYEEDYEEDDDGQEQEDYQDDDQIIM